MAQNQGKDTWGDPSPRTVAKYTEAERLLKEARNIVQASPSARNLNKDWLQRISDYFRRRDAGR